MSPSDGAGIALTPRVKATRSMVRIEEKDFIMFEEDVVMIKFSVTLVEDGRH